MREHIPLDRRRLGRALSQVINATVNNALEGPGGQPDSPARRVGFTGSPGVGKSSLISCYAKRRLDRGVRTGILAIDPTSPVSGGALLGDRIRMDAIADDSRLFIRSVPSRGMNDGLCDNAPDLLLAMEGHGFDEILLETVGVGQTEYAVKTLVDTLVLVLMPDSGDAIQAMKAGILECADILVMNKSDHPQAQRAGAEISAILKHRSQAGEDWTPQLIMASAANGTGVEELEGAVRRHGDWLSQHKNREAVVRQRRAYHLRSLIARRANEIIHEAGAELLDVPLREAFRKLVRGLGDA